MTVCLTCRKERDDNLMHAPNTIMPMLQEHLKEKSSDWQPDMPVCDNCVNEAMADDAEEMLEHLMGGELTPLEREVIEAMRRGGTMAQNIAQMDDDEHLSQTERLANRVANVVGTLSFPILILFLVAAWLAFTMQLGWLTSNPAIVFGGLSSALGTLAAIQNPIILLSQRRQARRDRLRNENEYRVNLKSELEIRYMNAKLDYMMHKLHPEHKLDEN